MPQGQPPRKHTPGGFLANYSLVAPYCARYTARPYGTQALTVAEANETTPILFAILAELDGKKATASKLSERLQMLEAMWGDGQDSPSNPDRDEFDELLRQMDDAVEELSALVEREILGRGMRFPPGDLANGLIDFPTMV